MKRWLLIGLIILALLAAAPFAAMRSETLTRWVLPGLLGFVPGRISLEHRSGALAGPLELADIHWRKGDSSIRLDRLRFDWSPVALWAGDLDIIDIDAGRLEIDIPPGPESNEPFDFRTLPGKLALPLEIYIESLTLESLHLAGNDDVSGLRLEAGQLRLDEDEIGVGHFEAWLDDSHATLSASIALEPPHAASASLQAEIAQIPGLQEPLPATLAVELAGSLDALDVDARLVQPAAAHLQARISDMPGDINWRGSLDVARVDDGELPLIEPLQFIELGLSFEGNPAGTAITGNAEAGFADTALSLEPELHITPTGVSSKASRIRVPDYSVDTLLTGDLDWQEGIRYDASLEINSARLPQAEDEAGRLDGSRLQLSGTPEMIEFELDGKFDDGSLAATGQMEFASGELNARVDWQDIVLPLQARPTTLESGSARLSGTPADYEFSAETGFAVTGLPTGRLQASGHGGRENITLDIESLRWLDGETHGELRLDIAARRLAWELEASELSPGMLLSGISGTLGFRATGESTLAADGPHDVRLAALDGSINGNALEGSGRLQLSGSDWRASGLDIKAGDASISLDGDTATAAGLGMQFDIPAIADLDARFGGSATGKFSWRRDNGSNWLDGEVRGTELLLPGFQAAGGTLKIDLDAAGERHSTFALELDDARVGERGIAAARFEVEGTRASNRVKFSLQATDGQLHAQAAGRWADDAWHGAVDELRLGARNAGAWNLREPFDLVAARNRVETGRFCLGQENAGLCAAADWQPGRWQAEIDLENAELQQFGQILPAGLDYRGGFELHGNIRNQPELYADIRLKLHEGSARRPDRDRDDRLPVLLEWQQGHVSLLLEDHVWTTDLELDLGTTGNISGGGTIGVPGEGSAASLDIGFDARIDQLDIIAALYPEVNRIGGTVRADLDIGGTTDDPRVTGSATVSDGSLQLARYGMQLDSINLELLGRGRNVILDGSIGSGGGTLEAHLDLAEEDGHLVASGTLQGDEFLASNTRELKLRISPDLSLQASGRDINITGALHVPMARIRPRQLAGTVGASDDQLFVDSEGMESERAERLQISARVRTSLGDKVDFEGFGLRADIGGALTVIREPDSPARGEGRLSVSNGRYMAYGQRLTLERGELIYTGQPLTEPGLDIRAVKQPAPDITVGINLRGSLHEPDFTLFSDPAMPEREQLSWLVLGRPATRGSGDEQQIDSASLALGIGGGAITGQLRDSFDLEEATLMNVDDPDEASLVLGKYLSPDLYVSYGIGLFDAANSFRIRYRLSSKWTLEAVSGLQDSADFLYTIER